MERQENLEGRRQSANLQYTCKLDMKPSDLWDLECCNVKISKAKPKSYIVYGILKTTDPVG